MNNNSPSTTELPSLAKLIKSTILAVCIAGVVLMTVVLPAEYGIDPTGIGNAIGLLKMGEIKTSLAEEATSEHQTQIQADTTSIPEEKANTNSGSKHDVVTVNLEPNEGKEIKLTMTKGAKVEYSWRTDGGKASFDAHADSKELQIDYHSYQKGKLQKSKGVLEAAFDGNHGWFWRNRTAKTMTVTLQVNGDYGEILRY